jgi:hypothetical protein
MDFMVLRKMKIQNVVKSANIETMRHRIDGKYGNKARSANDFNRDVLELTVHS